MESLSIEEIARIANVSTATVSRVLNNKPGVGKEKADVVRKILNNHNYSPRFTSEQHNTIGIIAHGFKNLFESYFLTQIMSGISESAALTGYDIKLMTSDSISDAGLNLRTFMRIKNLSAFLFLASHRYPDFVLNAEASDVPYLVVSNRFEGIAKVNWIDSDHEAAMKSAIQYLSGLGHRNIVYAGFVSEAPSQKLRIQYFKAAMSAYTQPVNDNAIILAKTVSMGDGYDLLAHILKLADRPTAIISTHENLAVAIVDAAKKMNITIPRDISLLNLGDTSLFDLMSPRITSISQHPADMGMSAVRTLIELQKKKPALPVSLIESVRLIQRETCMDLKR